MRKRKDDGGRGDLTDEQWQKLQPLLPPQKAHTGQPAHDHRRIINGILWLHRAVAPRRDIPERYGNHRTISSRFYRWRKAHIWQQIWSQFSPLKIREGYFDISITHQLISGLEPSLIFITDSVGQA